MTNSILCNEYLYCTEVSLRCVVNLYCSKQRHSGLWRSKSSGNLLPDSESLLLKRSSLICDEPRTPTALTAADLPITTCSAKGTYIICTMISYDNNNFHCRHREISRGLSVPTDTWNK